MELQDDLGMGGRALSIDAKLGYLSEGSRVVLLIAFAELRTGLCVAPIYLSSYFSSPTLRTSVATAFSMSPEAADGGAGQAGAGRENVL